MTTSTLERPADAPAGPAHAPGRRGGTWTCDNCRTETDAVRKRCADCGTSRY